MKALFTKLPLACLALVLITGCGKQNASGAKGINKAPGVTGAMNLPQVRDAFNNTSLSSGMENGDIISHTGPYFKSVTSSCITKSWLIFSATACLDTYSSTLERDMEESLIKKVASSSADSVQFQIPVDIDSQTGTYIYDGTETFDRNDSAYKEMLSLNQEPIETRISSATVTLNNSEKISGIYVEYFYGDKNNGHLNITSRKSFVLSTGVPVMANPMIAVNEHDQVIGGLTKINGKYVSGIKAARSHYVENTASWELINGYYQYVNKSIIRSRNQERNF